MKQTKFHGWVSFILGLLVMTSLPMKELRAGTDPGEIVEKSIKAQGGRAVLEKVKDTVATASCKFYTPQGEFLGERKIYYKTDPVKVRIEQTILGMETIIGFDGGKTWLQQMGRAMEAPAAINDSMKAGLAREDLLLKYKATGFKLEYLGESQVENSSCHRVKFIDIDGNETIYHFDAETYLPLKVEFDAPDETGKMVRSEVMNSDFREVENMRMPFKSVILADGKMNMETTIREIKINQGLDDKLFSMPAK